MRILRHLPGLAAILLVAASAYALTPTQRKIVLSARQTTPPSPLACATEMEIGDSRTSFGATLSRTGGSGNFTKLFSDGYSGWYDNAVNHALLDSPSGMYGVASTTSRNDFARLTDQGSLAANINTGTVSGANPAFASTSVTADKGWNINSMGATGPAAGPTTVAALNDSACSAFYLYDINDYAAAPNYYSTANPGISMAANLANVNALTAAGKHVFYLDGTPRGFSTVVLESHTAGATVTATNSTGHTAWDTFSSGGVIGIDTSDVMSTFALVGACGTTGQYTISGAVYTFCGTAPTGKIFLNYSWGSGNSARSDTAYYQALVGWAHSTAANYTNSACPSSNCSVAGLLYHNPLVSVINSYEALDSGDANHNAISGALTDGLHPLPFGAQTVAAAIRTKFTSLYPSMPTLASSPTNNAWNACTTTASATYSSSASSCGGTSAGAFPAAMQGSGCPTGAAGMEIFVDGAKAAKSDGAGNWISDGSFTVNSGTYNCGTGAWTVTFSANLTAAKAFVISQDPATIISNGLLDANQGVVALPANVTAAAGTSGVPKSYALAYDTCMINSLAGTGTPSGLKSISVTVATNVSTSPITVTDADGTWPAVKITIAGILNGTGCTAGLETTFNLKNTIDNALNRIAANSAFRAVMSRKVEAGPNGFLYGIDGLPVSGAIVVSSFTPSFATGALTSLISVADSGKAVFPLTQQSISGSAAAMIQPLVAVSPLVPTQDATITAAGATFNAQLLLEQQVPISVMVTFWRGKLSVRTL